MPLFNRQSTIDAPARSVFLWHRSPDALQKLIPPWEPVVVEQAPDSLANGQIAILVIGAGPFKLRWVARHRDFIDRGEDGGEFTDQQVSGPFAAWCHRHVVKGIAPAQCVLEDQIEYTLPFGMLGDLLAGWYVRRKLARMFEFRHKSTKLAVERQGVP